MSQPTPQSKVLRKDAQHNRLLLVDAAKRVFAREGFSATLHDVAREAGVGIGTVYRRFANKQELMREIYAEQVDELEGALRASLAMDDPWRGLVFYLEESLRIQVRDRGMAQIFSGHRMGGPVFNASKERIAPLVNRVVERGVEAGVVREDATGTDLIFAQVGVLAIARLTQQDSPGLYRRYLWLVLDSLHTEQPGPPLPVPALTTEETHRIFSNKE